eukprot:2364059-Rhodomonas_salina.2
MNHFSSDPSRTETPALAGLSSRVMLEARSVLEMPQWVHRETGCYTTLRQYWKGCSGPNVTETEVPARCTMLVLDVA